MPTLEALETALTDYKRAQTEFVDLVTRRDETQAQLNTLNGQISTAKASAAANENALLDVAQQFALDTRRAAR